VQQQIHLREQIRQRLGFAAKNAALLEQLSIFHRFALLLQMLKRLHQKSSSSAGWVENRFAKLRIGYRDHETDNGPRRVKFA